MRRLDCKQARRCLDGGAELELSDRQRSALEAHLAICEACSEHARLWEQLDGALQDEPLADLPPMVERRMLTGYEPATRRAQVVWSRVAVAGLAAACLALVVVIVGERVSEQEVEVLTAVEDGEPGPSNAELSIPTVIRGANPGTALWLESAAQVQTRTNDGEEARFVLDTGFVVAEIGPNEPGYRFVVETPASFVEAHGTVFSVEVTPLGEETIRVTEGVVEVRSKAGGAVHSLATGNEVNLPDEAPREATAEDLQRDLRLMAALPAWPDADFEEGVVAAQPAEAEAETETVIEIAQVVPENPPVVEQPQDGEESETNALDAESLTRLAQTQQRAGEFEAACSTYQELVGRWPDSVTARTGRVSLGQLQLDRMGRPVEALQQFDDYLAADPAGVLAEDARAGRVRALDQLARPHDVARAADRFLQYHPYSGMSAEVLRLRGDARRAQGDLLGAADDYQEVLDRWPGSPQATLASQGLAACLEGG